MRVGILGSGLMGGKLGTLFARAGHEVVFSYARSAQKLERLARETRGRASAGTPEEAARDADALLLAVHWSRVDQVLKQAGMSLADIDLFEINEAFAAVVLRYLQAFELDPGKVNVNGGAIAMGHPLGATGAMILGTVLDELERRDLSTALITLCIGAGMGTATIIERV